MRDRIADGVTIVTVTWESVELLRVLLHALDRFTHEPVAIVVVDNASTDGTSEYLATLPHVRAVQIGHNVGHGLALDKGIHEARTRFIITLDVDAFPISSEWVNSVIEPLRDGCTLAGAISSGYVHPCFMAIERSHFLREKYTFAASYNRRFRLPRRGQPRHWDAGKLITIKDNGPHFHLSPTSVRGPGSLGTVFGDVVYHHFYSTRLKSGWTDDLVRIGVTSRLSSQVWRDAVARYLQIDAG
jgi:glycosyltransferase involved in cell wall biosynthesis